MSDQLNDFINQQHRTNLELTAALSRIEQKITDHGERLFGSAGQKGALTHLYEQSEAVKVRVTELESWKRSTVKYVAGVVAVLTLEGSALAAYVKYAVGAFKTIKVLSGH